MINKLRNLETITPASDIPLLVLIMTVKHQSPVGVFFNNLMKGKMEFFISRNKDYNYEFIQVWPANEPIIKKEGCVYFQRSNYQGSFDYARIGADAYGMRLTPKQCRDLFMDIPEKGTIYHVYQKGNTIHWDEQDIDFTD